MFGIYIANEYYNIHLEIKIDIISSIREILAALKRQDMSVKLTFLPIT